MTRALRDNRMRVVDNAASRKAMPKDGPAANRRLRPDPNTASLSHPMMIQSALTEMMMQSGPVPVPAAFVAPPAYWTPDAMYLASIQDMILRQVHYYFSTDNLCKDEFLRGHMDPEGGWISISLLASFNRLRRLTTDISLITEVGLLHKRPTSSSLAAFRASLGGTRH